LKENFGYLFAAYTFIWALLAAYLGVLMAKQRSIRRQIDEISEKLESLSKK
jgi:CcmD family protein